MELLILINMLRSEPLLESKTLSSIAEVRAKYIYKSNDFSHNNFGKQFEGTGCKYMGENLARNFKNNKEAHKALIDSPSHKRVMTSSNFKYLGVGKYKSVTVELFCDKINQ